MNILQADKCVLVIRNHQIGNTYRVNVNGMSRAAGRHRLGGFQFQQAVIIVQSAFDAVQDIAHIEVGIAKVFTTEENNGFPCLLLGILDPDAILVTVFMGYDNIACHFVDLGFIGVFVVIVQGGQVGYFLGGNAVQRSRNRSGQILTAQAQGCGVDTGFGRGVGDGQFFAALSHDFGGCQCAGIGLEQIGIFPADSHRYIAGQVRARHHDGFGNGIVRCSAEVQTARLQADGRSAGSSFLLFVELDFLLV